MQNSNTNNLPLGGSKVHIIVELMNLIPFENISVKGFFGKMKLYVKKI